MKDFFDRQPVIACIALFFGAMLAAAVLMLPMLLVGLPSEAANAFARIAVGVLLMVMFRAYISWGKSGTGMALVLPVLAFVVWNLVYNLVGGGELITPTAFVGALILGLAPAVFEETIFRGIGINVLRKGGISEMGALVVSSVLFSAVHLTNMAGMGLVSVLVQVGYSLVVGLVLGAIYLVSGDLLAIICAHAAIDVSSQLFATHPSVSGWLAIALFLVLLVAEAAYALWLMEKRRTLGGDN